MGVYPRDWCLLQPKMAEVRAVVLLLLFGYAATQAPVPVKLSNLGGLVFAEVNDPSLLPSSFREPKDGPATQEDLIKPSITPIIPKIRPLSLRPRRPSIRPTSPPPASSPVKPSETKRSRRGVPGLVFSEPTDPSLLPPGFRAPKDGLTTQENPIQPSIRRPSLSIRRPSIRQRRPPKKITTASSSVKGSQTKKSRRGDPGLEFSEVNDPTLLPPSLTEPKDDPATHENPIKSSITPIRPTIKPFRLLMRNRSRSRRDLQRVPCHLVKDGKLRVKRDGDNTICYLVGDTQSYSQPRISYSSTEVSSYSHIPQSYSNVPQSYIHVPQSYRHVPQSYSQSRERTYSHRPRDSYRPLVHQSRTVHRTSPRRSGENKRVWYYKPEGSHRSQIHHVERY